MEKQELKRLDTKEAADFLTEVGVKTTAGTLEVKRCQGRGPRFYKVGRNVYYDPRDLWQFAKGRPVETVDSAPGAHVGLIQR